MVRGRVRRSDPLTPIGAVAVIIAALRRLGLW
jgi:hypothetical protein